MESAEKDCGMLGNLFQTIINDLRGSSPIWEDFTCKATKLHHCLKTTLVAISSFLEAFQRVADMATNSRGATKEVGAALTRLCMRHRSIEACLKALTSSFLDSMVAPLQERLEDWKKVVVQLDKDHSKEYKKARQEIKKAASDTMRLQKKVKKGIPLGKSEMQSKLDVALHDVNSRYHQLEEAEKNAVRSALIEERGRFCLFITCIKPFVDHEIQLLTEVTHLQEIMHSLCLQASDPHTLPASSEQVISDLKGMDPAAFSLQVKQRHSPPSSPSSLGSRKSSMCSINSINSINSSSSGSSKSHSPSHTMHRRTASQAYTGDNSGASTGECDSAPTTPHLATTPTLSSDNTCSLASASSSATRTDRGRPHTISAASERCSSRPALTSELFEPLPGKAEHSVQRREGHGAGRGRGKVRSHSSSSAGHPARPAASITKMQPVLPPHCPRPKAKAVPPPALPPGTQPEYANTADLQRLARENQARQQQDGTEQGVSSGQSVQPAPQPTDVKVLDLDEAMRGLDSVTAALVTDIPEEEVAATVAAEREATEKREQQEIEMRRSSRSHKMQQNSMELAAAIRELEESTAALQSSYDCASHKSLQCSSGYATMNSTPTGSQDTIASGDLELSSVSQQSEKYFTVPRHGEMRTALPSALCAKRPVSTTGIPASSASTSRKSCGSMARPPPPVRRTLSVSSSSSGGAPVHSSPEQGGQEGGLSPASSEGSSSTGPSEGAYAELHFIQQSIHQKKRSLQQPVPAPKPGPLQRQSSAESPHHHPHMSSPSPDRISISSGSSSGSGHYAVPNFAPSSPSSASVLQSLNAKFASLTQQYQDPQYGPPPSNGRPAPPPAPLSTHPAAQHRGQGHGPTHLAGAHLQQGHPHSPRGAAHQSAISQPGQGYPYQGHAGNLHAQMQQEGEAEDFPLPPTAEELAEMENVYTRPPPLTPKPTLQGNLMMELKRRMSAEEATDV